MELYAINFPLLGIAGPERNALYKKYFQKRKKTELWLGLLLDICWKRMLEYQYVTANYFRKPCSLI